MIIRRGTSIIEIVIAVALISVSILAALSLANRSQKQNTYAKGLAEATKYATQGADWIRTERDTIGWATISAKALAEDNSNIATYCLNTLPTSGSGTDFTSIAAGACNPNAHIASTLYTRTMTIDTSQSAQGFLKIILSVTWQEEVERSAKVELELAQWR